MNAVKPKFGKWVFLNNNFVQREDAKLSVIDNSTVYGGGVYDVVIREDGGEIFQLKEHVERFIKSAQLLGVKFPCPEERLTSVIKELVEKNNVREGSVYMHLSFGTHPSGLRKNRVDREKRVGTLFIITQPIPRYGDDAYTKGYAIQGVPDPRWRRCNIKTSFLLANMLAFNDAKDAGFNDAYFYEPENHNRVTEGSAVNLFMVKDGVIYTCCLAGNRTLPGITRATTLKVGRANGLTILEQDFSREFLHSADEVFVTSTTKQILPVRQIDNVKLSKCPGPVTLKVAEMMIEYLEKETGIVMKHRRKLLKLPSKAVPAKSRL